MPDTPLPVYGEDRQCDGCGACCFFIEWPPYRSGERVAPGPARAIQAAVGTSRQDMSCLFLTDKLRCEYYDDKPEVCGEYEVNGIECLPARIERRRDAIREEMFKGRDAATELGVDLHNGTGTTAGDGSSQGVRP